MSETYDVLTHAVIGDVHAHIQPLKNALIHLGWDEDTYRIPHNLVIVQAGDLIHKGPFTNEIVSFVDAIIEANNSDDSSGSWVQLMGNHESQYFEDTPKFWRFECDVHTITTMGKWWQNDDMKYHHVIEQNDGKPFLITHAGVNPFWYYKAEPFFKALGRGQKLEQEEYLEFRQNQSVDNFSSWLDEIKAAPAIATMTGTMLEPYKTNHRAGPVWAETVSEVYCAWMDEPAPFHQIHGHVTPFNWRTKKFYPLVSKRVQNEIRIFKNNRRTLWENSDGTQFYGIDNGFDRTSDLERIRPLILNANGVIISDRNREYFVNAKGKLEEIKSR